jgi:hypothetical protein
MEHRNINIDNAIRPQYLITHKEQEDRMERPGKSMMKI